MYGLNYCFKCKSSNITVQKSLAPGDTIMYYVICPDCGARYTTTSKSDWDYMRKREDEIILSKRS